MARKRRSSRKSRNTRGTKSSLRRVTTSKAQKQKINRYKRRKRRTNKVIEQEDYGRSLSSRQRRDFARSKSDDKARAKGTSVPENRNKQREQRRKIFTQSHDDNHSRVTRARCKKRPTNNASKGGGSRSFIPWCV